MYTKIKGMIAIKKIKALICMMKFGVGSVNKWYLQVEVHGIAVRQLQKKA